MNWKDTFEIDRHSVALDNEILKLLNNGMSEKDIKKATGVNELYIDEERVYQYINSWTEKSIFKLPKILRSSQLLKNNQYFKSMKKKGKMLMISTQDGELKIRKLSEIFPIVKKIDNGEIETSKRKRGCAKSLNIALLFKSDCKLVSGIDHGLSDKSKYFHTWVEIEAQGKEYVVDYNSNTLMNKDGFYKLNKIEVLSVIPYFKLNEDAKKIKGKACDFDFREYLLDRDSVIEKIDCAEHDGLLKNQEM